MGLEIEVCCATPSEPAAGKDVLVRQRGKPIRRIRRRSLGADKGYHLKNFVRYLRDGGIAPHRAAAEGQDARDLDRRTTRRASYWLSPPARKCIEGRMKKT